MKQSSGNPGKSPDLIHGQVCFAKQSTPEGVLWRYIWGSVYFRE